MMLWKLSRNKKPKTYFGLFRYFVRCLHSELGRRSPVEINNWRANMATRKTNVKSKSETQANEQPDGVTLEQALKEECEGRTPESIINEGKKQTDGPSKVEKAMKIMEEMWGDIQSGKVKRKDVIKRFMEEIPLSKAGSSTYYSNCKQKILKTLRND